MNIFWLLRMRRWAQNPPSGRTVMLGLALIAALLALYFAERAGLLPDWMALDPARAPTRVPR
jgi:hypothetical protein